MKERASQQKQKEGKRRLPSKKKKERSRELMVVPVVCTVDGENQRMGVGNQKEDMHDLIPLLFVYMKAVTWKELFSGC